MSDQARNPRHTFRHNSEAKRFELRVGDDVAFLEYIPAGRNISLTHTEVPPSLSGQGIGSALVGYALDEIRTRELKIIPICPFVTAYLRRHPAYRDLIFGYRRQDT